MNDDDIRKNTFRIGAFRVEPTRNLLKKDGQTFPLEPRIMDVLCELASHPSDVISRFDLIKRIWKVDYGADESLTRAVSVLRKTFRKGGETEKYIETISKVGYRLIAHVGPWDEPIARRITAVPDHVPAPNTPISRPVPQPVTTQATQTPVGTSEPAIVTPTTQPIINTPTPSSPRAYQTKAEPAAAPRKNRSLPAALFGLTALGVVGVSAAAFLGDRVETPTPVTTAQPAPPTLETQAPNSALSSVRPLTVDTGLVFGNAVAVLSFSDMSLSGDQEYFADGMAEELLTQLYTIPDLRVISRQASFAFKGQRVDPREIGRKLQVSHIIAGSVRTNGDLVRVSTQLINAQDASQLWSKSYTGRLADGFTIQEQIARDTMTELSFILSGDWDEDLPEDIVGIEDHSTFDPETGNFDPNTDNDDAFDAWSPTGPPQ
ncbi:winged helix-turn-helix domain-containing protein [Fretibacter rubidus]|uniref:winged helix-turn-helix domain-containing protein n=1 Tax=Fretibacter rubidus TaxID=570162 RepID=UPI00352BC9CB